VNTISIIGRLTRDPESGQTMGGTPVSKLRLAYDKPVNREKPCYVDVIVYGKNAENCNKYLEAKQQVGITGELDWEEWTKDDVKRQRNFIVARNVTFLAKAKGDSAAPEAEQQEAPTLAAVS
jgi:single-strand DNA-binding protein